MIFLSSSNKKKMLPRDTEDTWYYRNFNMYPQRHKLERCQNFFDRVFEKYPEEHKKAIEGTRVYDIRHLPETKECSTNVVTQILPCDSLQYADTRKDVLLYNKTPSTDLTYCKGTRPLVLNMAEGKKAGGTWLRMTVKHEESICRRSNLGYYLEHITSVEKVYPLSDYQCIYVPNVCVFMKQHHFYGNEIRFSLLPEEEWYFIDVLTVPFPSPERPFDVNLMRLKINAMFHLALYYQNKRLILGAFGCETDDNERKRKIIRLFTERGRRMRGQFYESPQHVIFAIVDDGMFGTDNYRLFMDDTI